MSHTVHPFAHRLGILRDWKSRWFTLRGREIKYRDNLKADVLVRTFLEKRLKGMYINSIEIERGENNMKISIHTSRPGVIIGRSGEGASKLKSEIEKKMRKLGLAIPSTIKLDIIEIRSPESHAGIVAEMIIEALEKRMSFRRVIKQIAEKVMANRDVKGVKIQVSGRLDGADMSRRETIKKGRLPLQTFRSDVDFAINSAHLPTGYIGIKVWIYRGDIFKEKGKDTNNK